MQTHTTTEDVNTDQKKDIPFGVDAQQGILENIYRDTSSTQTFSFTNGVGAMNTSKVFKILCKMSSFNQKIRSSVKILQFRKTVHCE